MDYIVMGRTLGTLILFKVSEWQPFWISINILHMNYSVSQKNTPDIFSCNLNKYFPIEIIFGTSIT